MRALSLIIISALCCGTTSSAETLDPEEPRVVRVRAGGKIGINDRKQVIRAGIAAPGGTRRILDAFLGITVAPEDKRIGTRFTDKAIAIEAAREAVGRVYQVTVSMRVRRQEIRVRNKREIWVTTETETEDETFTLVVDFPKFPKVRLAPDQMYWIVAPKDVRWTNAEAQSPRRLEARSSDRKITFIARKDGRNAVEVRYQIGATQLEGRVVVDVEKKPIRLSASVEAGANSLIPITDLEKLTQLRNGRILDWRADSGPERVALEIIENTLRLTGKSAGETRIDLIFEGMERRGKSPVHVVITLDVTVGPDGK